MSPEKSKRLLEGSIVSSLLILAVPIVLGNLLQTAYQLIDAFWVGRLGGTAVAAVSVVFPISFLTMALGMGFSIAASSLVAQYAGAKQMREVRHATGQAVLIALVLSIILAVGGYFLAPHILGWFGVAPEVRDVALSYMKISFLSIPFSFLFMTYQSIVRGVGEVTWPLYIVATTVLINAIADPFFIFGWGGMPALGAPGAALATLLTQAIAATVGLTVLIHGVNGAKLTWVDMRPDKAFLLKIARLGIPTSLEQTIRALGSTAMISLVVGFGTIAVAAYGVGSNVMMVVIIPALGLSMAVSALVGQNIGAGNIGRAKEIVRLGSIVSFVMLSVVGVFVYFFAPWIVRFFITDGNGDVTTLAVSYVRVMTLTFGMIGVQMAFFGVFRAVGAPTTAMLLTALSQLITFPLAYILAHYTSLGVAGIWWALPIANLITVLITWWWYKRGKWESRRLTKTDVEEREASEEIMTGGGGMRNV